jgi:hypothetical protein
MGVHTGERSAEADFAAFTKAPRSRKQGARLRRVLVAHCGVEFGDIDRGALMPIALLAIAPSIVS